MTDPSSLRAQKQRIDGIRAALALDENDDDCRLRLAEALVDANQHEEALRHLGTLLAKDPTSGQATALMRRLMLAGPVGPAAEEPPAARVEADEPVADLTGDSDRLPVPTAGPPLEPEGPMVDTRATLVRLADVAGMEHVKQRLDAAFLTPMTNPDKARRFGHSMRGGLLLYGPPGCGKTFIARAVAGELGANFLSVTLADALDMWMGQSEKNIRRIFDTARANTPCVLFIDEVDALGGKRSNMHHTGMRTVVSQLLTELDSVEDNNAGVFVLGATNHPWDLDSAMRRPGRFDRMLFVTPPDDAARMAIIQLNLRGKPVGDIAYASLVRKTEDFSGADLTHLCQAAGERAMLDSIRTGKDRNIETEDFTEALKEIRPSTRSWFNSARQVAQFANNDNAYDELISYLRRRRAV